MPKALPHATPRLLAQSLAERHLALMRDLEQRMDDERGALRQEATAVAVSAAAAGEERGRAAAMSRHGSNWLR